MKSLLRKIAPNFVHRYYMRAKRLIDQKRNINKSTEEVFTDIYKNNKWGGKKGEFYSGDGTSSETAASAYVTMLSKQASTEKFSGREFVDLGCGDFRIGKEILFLCSKYTGVDVVKPLIERNQAQYGNPTTNFVHLDIVKDNLPDGDVCFVRQVLQHLSNQQISIILQKLSKYTWVFITEHYPTENSTIKPNVDKSYGGDIRLYDNSGVYLTYPPFSLPANQVTQVLEVAAEGDEKSGDPGVIRTFLYKPSH